MANEITSQNAAQAIVKLVATEFLPALRGNLTMGQLVNRDFEPALANAGDTVNVPIAPASYTPNNIAEAGTVTNQNANLGNAQIVLNSHKEVTFVIPDITKILVQPDLLAMHMQAAVNGMAEAIEGDLLGLYPQLTANTAVGTGNTTLVESVLDSAETALFKAKVPQSDPRYLVCSADAYGQIRQISRFTELQTVGSGDSIVTGDIMKVKNLNVIRSQYVKKPSTTTYNLGFTRNAFALAMRRLPQPLPGTGAIAQYVELAGYGFRVTMSYQPNTLAQQFTVDALYGCGVLRNNHGLQVLN